MKAFTYSLKMYKIIQIDLKNKGKFLFIPELLNVRLSYNNKMKILITGHHKLKNSEILYL